MSFYPADFSNAVIGRIAASGLIVDFRECDPLLTRADLARSRMIVLESSAGTIGSGLAPGPTETIPLARFVQDGGLLVLAIPQDPDAFSQLNAYNQILDALGSGIRVVPAIADDESGRYLSVMFPQCYFHPCDDTFAARGVNHDLVLDRATILDAKPPALVLAKSSPSAFARAGLGRSVVKEIASEPGGFPLVAMARCGKGFVLVIPRFSLNIGGFNSRVGVGPLTSLDWLPSSERFVQNLIDELVKLGRGESVWNGPSSNKTAAPALIEPVLPAAPPAGLAITTVPAGGSLERARDKSRSNRNAYRATIRRDLYGPYLEHGLRAAWGDIDRDGTSLKTLASGFKAAGFNYIWGVGWPERFVSNQYTEPQRDRLRRSWETFACELDGSAVGWSIGVDFAGQGFDRKGYELCRGPSGQELRLLSPLDLRYWYDMMIPALEEVARFSLHHPSVKGATIDFELYDYDPFKVYPEAIGFENVAFSAFLRASHGHLDGATLAAAAELKPAERYPWLRDRGLLGFYFLQLENESEKLGRLIRRRIHAIQPDFIFGGYQAALPYSWFYRGLIRGLSTPEMPMVWMSFQVLSAPDIDRFWLKGCSILNATALMLGTFPIREYPAAMSAGRWLHDGYWINRFNWLADDARGKKSIEIPDGTRAEAWRSPDRGQSPARHRRTAGRHRRQEGSAMNAHRLIAAVLFALATATGGPAFGGIWVTDPDGRPFFPIGLYGFPQGRKDDAIYREAHEAGFNFLVGHEAKSGFMRSVDLPGGPPDSDAASRRGSLLDLSKQTDHKRGLLEALIAKEENTPGLLVWQGPDEPNDFPFGIRPGPTPAGLALGARTLKSKSKHPLWINFGPTGDDVAPADFDRLRPYLAVPDVVSVDIYPVGGGSDLQLSPFAERGPACVGVFTRNLVRLVSHEGIQQKPVWMVLQAFGWGDLAKASNPPEKWTGRPPTHAEIRFMAFDAIINGAGGVIFWGAPYQVKTDGTWEALKTVAREVRDLLPILTANPQAADRIVKPSNPAIEAAVRRSGEDLYVLLANTGERLEETSLSFHGVKAGSLRPVGITAKKHASDTIPRVTFEPLEVTVFAVAD